MNERDELEDVLRRSGFVPCDIPACNCGSWHHRYGLPQRMVDITDALTDADVLDNSTGNLPIRAIEKLVKQRDVATEKLAWCDKRLAHLEKRWEALKKHVGIVTEDACMTPVDDWDAGWSEAFCDVREKMKELETQK